jgi:16S rRNA (guanine1207-N2)-methyltransferase
LPSRRKHRDEELAPAEIAPYPQESLLINALPEMRGERFYCMSPGLGQFAATVAGAMPAAAVTCTYLDLYRANLATEFHSNPPANLKIECAADLPGDEVDLVALPFSARGEAELTRDLMQMGHQRLRVGGRMFVSIDNNRDIWLRDQLRTLFGKLDCRFFPTGNLYVGTKTGPLKKIKNFASEFAFRDQGRLISAYSRPGVFSHRHVDVGARRLIDEMQIEPDMRVLDIGCGAGIVALAAACRGESVAVHAVDSSARAIQCTQLGAELNGLTNITTELNASGGYIRAGSYDLAVANPPYYASFQIAEHFLVAGRVALKLGGRMLVVTKSPGWYQENMPKWYDSVTLSERKGYVLIEGVRP